MTQIFQSYSEFLNREDQTINGVSPQFAERVPDFEKQNETNKGCWNCVSCVRCERQKNNGDVGVPEIPVIENIHQKILAAINDNGNQLNMSDWHTCNTTHCRGGWVNFLAGEAGKRLEEKTSTSFAAMHIYYKSSPIKVSPTEFYKSDEVAMADIVRCAEEEAKLEKT